MRNLHIRIMSQRDASFAVKLTSLEKWGYTRREIDRMLELEPQGCFVASAGNEKLGMLTTICYGELGWIGNVIVNPKARGRSIGFQLVKHALDYLRSRGVETGGLFSYPHAISFYEKLGFKPHEKFLRLSAKGQPYRVVNVEEMTGRDIPAVVLLDEECKGFSRKHLLHRMFPDRRGTSFVSRENEALKGYVMAEKSSTVEIGPLICRRTHSPIVEELLKAVMARSEGSTVSIGIPEHARQTRRIVGKLGFKPDFEVISMYHGRAVIERSSCITAMESLERG